MLLLMGYIYCCSEDYSPVTVITCWILYSPQYTGSDLSEVQEYISPDQLPEAYGGTRCEPDPYCTKYVSSALS